MVATFHHPTYYGYNAYMLFYYSFYAAAWILFAIGYIFFGVKLLGIIPALMKGTVIRVSFKNQKYLSVVRHVSKFDRRQNDILRILGDGFDGLIRGICHFSSVSSHRHAS
jgi:hypothetical protein